jgi:hypothetical protein
MITELLTLLIDFWEKGIPKEPLLLHEDCQGAHDVLDALPYQNSLTLHHPACT